MTTGAVSEINVAVREIGGAIRTFRESRDMSLDDLSREVSGVHGDIKIASKTIELIEQGVTDTQLDQMLALLAAAGIDMQFPDSSPASRRNLVNARLADIRDAMRKARHPPGLRKISYKALSDACGIEQGQIGKIESGDIMPRFRTLLVLTRALDITVRFAPIGGKSIRTETAARASTLRRGRSRSRSAA